MREESKNSYSWPSLLFSSQAFITKNQNGWLKQQRFIILSVLEVGSLKADCHRGLLTVRALFLACRCQPSHCVVTWQEERENMREHQRASKLSGFFHNGTNPIMKPPTVWPVLNLIISLRPYL